MAIGRKTGGRTKGALNLLSSDAKEVIAGVAGKLGGMNRLVEWAKEDPANERAFWVQVYPKLLPVQVGGDKDNPLYFAMIERRVIRPDP